LAKGEFLLIVILVAHEQTASICARTGTCDAPLEDAYVYWACVCKYCSFVYVCTGTCDAPLEDAYLCEV